MAKRKAKRARRAFTPEFKGKDTHSVDAAFAASRSMSSKGDCWDNAVAESFFATLRAELVDDVNYRTRDLAEKSIGRYIDGFYNVERLHSHLDHISPIEFELKMHVSTIDGIEKLSTRTGQLHA